MSSHCPPEYDNTENKCLIETDDAPKSDHDMYCKYKDKRMRELEKEVKRLTEQNGDLSIQILKLNCNIRTLKYDLRHKNSKMIDVDHILTDGAKLKFYTGFENAVRFKIFAEFIAPGYNLARRTSHKNTETNTGRKRVLSYTEQLFLILCRLKSNIPEQDLAYRFNISIGTVHNLWSFWINLLSSQLTQVPIWPSKTLVDKYMPQTFKELYPSTRVVLHCMELHIETKQSHTSVKGLIGVTPNGLISFVSDLYPSKKSNHQITVDSGILSFLEEGDTVIASKEFTAEELRNIDLIVPTFEGATDNANKSSDKASLRLLRNQIRRTTSYVKTFKILTYVFPNTMRDDVNQIWKICCYLCNFINEPLLDQ